MNEEAKLREARYFLDRMAAELEEPELFKFNLSAFLSAARSVAQYALNEASGKRGGRRWYDSFFNKAPTLKFLASERDTNIHHRPVEPSGHVDVYASELGDLSEHWTMEKFDVAGNLVEVTSSDNPERDESPAQEFRLVFNYRFQGWSGPEDVPALCSQYLAALTDLVEDGQRSGLLSK